MRKLSFGIAIALLGTMFALLAGCGGSDPNAAKTPAGASTITNGQVPTAGGGGTATGGEGKGDATAGKATFEATCQGCHAKDGTMAAVGPVLADRGLTADEIRTQIVNGGGAMPPNLVSGGDLDNVVAFVVGIQGGKAPSGGAPPANAPTITSGQPPASGGGGAATGGGDAAAIAAGKTFFEGTCQGCHAKDGTVAGVGPVLTGGGRTADRIRSQVVNGGGAMPAGLASGADLDSVVAFVLSIQ